MTNAETPSPAAPHTVTPRRGRRRRDRRCTVTGADQRTAPVTQYPPGLDVSKYVRAPLTPHHPGRT